MQKRIDAGVPLGYTPLSLRTRLSDRQIITIITDRQNCHRKDTRCHALQLQLTSSSAMTERPRDA